MRWLEAGPEIADILDPYRAVDRTPRRGPVWVMANMVGGLNGSATIGGRVGGLSDEVDARLFRLLRSCADVVLVGAETVRRERYGPVRLPDEHRAARVAAGRAPVPPLAVLSRSLALDWESPAFTEAAPEARTVVVTCASADPAALAAARAAGDVVIAGDERVELAVALAALADRGAGVVLCEGGPTVLGELAAADLLDELCLTIAPVLGGDSLPVAVTPPGAEPRRLRLAQTAVDGSTLFLRYERDEGAGA